MLRWNCLFERRLTMDFYEYNDMVQQWVSQVLENTGKNEIGRAHV